MNNYNSISKQTIKTEKLKTDVINSVEFENFKDNFLFAFVFKQIERPNFNEFLIIHFKVYNILYKNICTVREYAKIALHEELNDFETYGMVLK